jgi:hypothetical protein
LGFALLTSLLPHGLELLPLTVMSSSRARCCSACRRSISPEGTSRGGCELRLVLALDRCPLPALPLLETTALPLLLGVLLGEPAQRFPGFPLALLVEGPPVPFLLPLLLREASLRFAAFLLPFLLALLPSLALGAGPAAAPSRLTSGR